MLPLCMSDFALCIEERDGPDGNIRWQCFCLVPGFVFSWQCVLVAALNLESFTGVSPAVPCSPPPCYKKETQRPEGICLGHRDMYSSIKHAAVFSVGWTNMSRRWAGPHVCAFDKSANV